MRFWWLPLQRIHHKQAPINPVFNAYESTGAYSHEACKKYDDCLTSGGDGRRPGRSALGRAPVVVSRTPLALIRSERTVVSPEFYPSERPYFVLNGGHAGALSALKGIKERAQRQRFGVVPVGEAGFVGGGAS